MGGQQLGRWFVSIDCKFCDVIYYFAYLDSIIYMYTHSFVHSYIHSYIHSFVPRQQFIHSFIGPTTHIHFIYLFFRKNLILSQVLEERTVDAAVYSDNDTPSSNPNNTMITAKRSLAQAMIPGSHLIKVEIDQSTYDQYVQPVTANWKCIYWI